MPHISHQEVEDFIAFTNVKPSVLLDLKRFRIPLILKGKTPQELDALRASYYDDCKDPDEEKAKAAFIKRHPEYKKTPFPFSHFYMWQAHGIIELAYFLGKCGYVKRDEDVSTYREAILRALNVKIINNPFSFEHSEERVLWESMKASAYVYSGIIKGDIGTHDLYQGAPSPFQEACSDFLSALSAINEKGVPQSPKSIKLYQTALLIQKYSDLGKTEEEVFKEAEKISKEHEEESEQMQLVPDVQSFQTKSVKENAFFEIFDKNFDKKIKESIEINLTQWKQKCLEVSPKPSASEGAAAVLPQPMEVGPKKLIQKALQGALVSEVEIQKKARLKRPLSSDDEEEEDSHESKRVSMSPSLEKKENSEPDSEEEALESEGEEGDIASESEEAGPSSQEKGTPFQRYVREHADLAKKEAEECLTEKKKGKYIEIIEVMRRIVQSEKSLKGIDFKKTDYRVIKQYFKEWGVEEIGLTLTTFLKGKSETVNRLIKNKYEAEMKTGNSKNAVKSIAKMLEDFAARIKPGHLLRFKNPRMGGIFVNKQLNTLGLALPEAETPMEKFLRDPKNNGFLNRLVKHLVNKEDQQGKKKGQRALLIEEFERRVAQKAGGKVKTYAFKKGSGHARLGLYMKNMREYGTIKPEIPK
ncbi:MAG: hypothetical protein JSS34_05230 [Proteobacteria bacterium]|nr:hypothetical protein [Pseudomonadota bacterium]